MGLLLFLRLPARWRRGALAGGLALLVVAAQAQPELMRLKGLTRDELLRQLGPPSSRAMAGEREILTFREARVTLQQDVVVEVAMPVPAVSSPPASPAGPAATAASTASNSSPASALRRASVPPAPSTAPAGPAVAPAAPKARTPAAPVPDAKPATAKPRMAQDAKSLLGRLLPTAILLAVVAGGAAVLGIWARRRRGAARPAEEARASATAAPPPSASAGPSASASIKLPARVFTALDARLLGELEWKRFEELVAAFFRASGFTAKLTPTGSDGGVDIHLHRDGEEKPLAYVQCKSWHSQDVGVKTVRELYGVMMADGVMEGHLVAVGGFSADARKFAAGKNLRLVDGEELAARFNRLTEGERQRILAAVTTGDYTTPTCPNCDVKLVLRGEDRSFWGCPRYPRCRYTMIARRAA
jgi:hypothetical protein